MMGALPVVLQVREEGTSSCGSHRATGRSPMGEEAALARADVDDRERRATLSHARARLRHDSPPLGSPNAIWCRGPGWSRRRTRRYSSARSLMSFLTALILVSGLSFLTYGMLCLSSGSMKDEFERFGLAPLRLLTGALEVLGGLGLLLGLTWPLALGVSSGGLSLLMLFGLGVRVKMRDGFWQSLPALVLMLANLYILVESLAAMRH